MAEETFTDFMVRCMTGEDSVMQAFVAMRRENGTIGYKCFRQEFGDGVGLLRVAQLSVENELIQRWKGEGDGTS